MDVMDLRKGLLMGMASDDWNIILKPVGPERIIPCVQFAVTVGQKITISWKSDAAYTYRYFMRTLNSTLDNETQYKLYGPATYGLSGTLTCTVTGAGNIQFGGYANGLLSSCNIGDYVKVKIENPEE